MKIAHFPQHVNHSIAINLTNIKHRKWRSAGFTEMDSGPFSSIPMMRKILSPALIATAGAKEPGKHSQEVPIACRTNFRNKADDHYVIFLSPDLGIGLHNDRHMTVVKWRRGVIRRRKWAHLAIHLNAGIQDKDTGRMHEDQAVRVTEKAVDRIEEEITKLVEDGYQVVLTGDWNWRIHTNGATWVHSPVSVARRHKMNRYSTGLDHILWTKGLVKVGRVQVIPPGRDGNHADHPWLIIGLRFKLF